MSTKSWQTLLSIALLLDVPALYARSIQRFLITTSPGTHNVYYTRLMTFEELALPKTERPSLTPKVLINGADSACHTGALPATGNAARLGRALAASGGATLPIGCDENSDQGLRNPEGLAIYNGAEAPIIYVSDTVAQKIYAYELIPSGDTLSVGTQRKVKGDVNGGAQSLATDGVGNLFFSSLGDGTVNMIAASSLFPVPTAGTNAASLVINGPEAAVVAATDAAADSTDAEGTVASTDASTATAAPAATAVGPVTASSTVSKPGALAADGFFLYWGNTEGGATAGTVVQGYERLRSHGGDISSTYPRALAQNSPTAYGICIARDNVYFTADAASAPALFAVKKEGGAIAQVSSGLTAPKGCAYDGDGTLYIADSGANAIYSIPANYANLRAVTHLNRILSVSGPSQVVVFDASASATKSLSLFLALLAFAALFA